MPTCRLCGKKCRVARFDGQLLEGDTFYDYFCSECSDTKDGTFERHQLSWQTVIHLVMYHLQKTNHNGCNTSTDSGNDSADAAKAVFFRWKEDICSFIERNWGSLIPQKNPGVSWQNSVSSVLSAHHEVFLNGLEAKGETGWWALRVCEPPRVKSSPITLQMTGGNIGRTVDGAALSSSNDGRRKHSVAEESDQFEIKSEAGSIELIMIDDDQMSENGAIDGASQAESQPATAGSSELIKKQLLSRLLSEDSSLLQAALTNVTRAKVELFQSPSSLALSSAAPSSSLPSPQKTVSRTRTSSCRAPPVENELLRILSRVKNPDCKLKRLRRKLLARRERRKAGIEMFDLDSFIYNYLKDPKPFNEKGERMVDLFPSANASATAESTPANASQDGIHLDVETPYQSNRCLSMKYKVLGATACAGFPSAMVSPFSGQLLPEYILRDAETFGKTCKGSVLHSLKRLFGDPLSHATVDFMHLRREHVLPLNRLLSLFFWPGIDISEAAESYPDHSIVAVYNTWLVVGAALVDPDGYLSHLLVHPDWAGAGIGRRLLDLLLQSAPPRDITLHVSVTSPAMLLYNQCGFKPEQYIVNYYDKYYRMAEQNEQCAAMSAVLQHSKNAFLMRLRR